MSEQAGKIKRKAIPEWAEGLYYNSGMFHEVLVYHTTTSLSTSSTKARRTA